MIKSKTERILEPGVYSSQPLLFSPDIITCACVLRVENTVLFLKKAPGRWSANLWGIPCGKIEEGENLPLAMQRELKEEMGYVADESALIYVRKVFIVQKDGVHNEHHLFYVPIEMAPPIRLSHEHVEGKWFDKEDFVTMPLIPFQKEILALCKIGSKQVW